MPKNEIVTSRAAVRRALASVVPTRIAVAYVGAGWRDLLGAKELALKQIVLAPVQGTNPWAIVEIAKEIGWENVHFLEQLHAKVFLGKGQVLLGSANLSDNALGTGRADLYELMLHSDDRMMQKQVACEFDRYVALARSEYPTTQAKLARVADLKRMQPELDRARRKLDRRAAPSFSEFEIGRHRIYLEWWGSEGDDGGADGDISFMNVILGAEKALLGSWMLTWRCLKSGRPGKSAEVEWLRIDEVRRELGEEKEYMDQVAQTHRHLPGVNLSGLMQNSRIRLESRSRCSRG